MNKKTIVCSLLAMALILTGTGYAYWTDSLKVTTKATTGDMEVTFVDLGLYAQYPEDELNYGVTGWSIIDGIRGTDNKGFVDSTYFRRGTSDFNSVASSAGLANYAARAEGYHDVEFDAELVDGTPIKKTVRDYAAGQVNGSDEIKISINNMYPGYAQAFRSDILNVGSIAARLSRIDFTVGAIADGPEINNQVKSMLGAAILIEREYQVGSEVVPTFELCKSLNLSASDIFTVGGVNFVRLTALEDLSNRELDFNELLALPNGNSMDFFIGVAMDPDAVGTYTTGSTEIMNNNDDTLSQNKGAELTVKLLWDQFNEGVNAETSNILIKQN